jgi:hypothetical protein
MKDNFVRGRIYFCTSSLHDGSRKTNHETQNSRAAEQASCSWPPAPAATSPRRSKLLVATSIATTKKKLNRNNFLQFYRHDIFCLNASIRKKSLLLLQSSPKFHKRKKRNIGGHKLSGPTKNFIFNLIEIALKS